MQRLPSSTRSSTLFPFAPLVRSPAHGPAGPDAVKGNAGADPLACAIGSVDPAAGARGGDGTHSAFMGDAASLAVIARGDGRTGGRRGCRTLFRRLRREQQVVVVVAEVGHRRRSEEHTSELQSLMRISYAVFCLKKKQK